MPELVRVVAVSRALLRSTQLTVVGLFTIVLWASARPSSAQSTDRRSFPSDSALRPLLERFVKEGRSAGIVVGLLEPNSEPRVLAYGSPGPGKLPLDGNSVFRIASITKVFTGTLLASLTVDGTVAVDDPVERWLPSGVKVPQRNGRVITLRDLATHTSGLPRSAPDLPPGTHDNMPRDYTVSRLYAAISAYTLPRDPGERWEYSNIGAAFLGHALAHAAGKPYEQLIAERILIPLGMEHTAVTPSRELQEHLALGHDAPVNCGSARGCRFNPVPPVDDPPAIIPAGGLYSTTNDLLRFLAANIGARDRPADALGRAMVLAQRTHYEGALPTRPVVMGLNWFPRPTPTDTIFWQGGGMRGYATFIAFTPSRRAVVVLTNGGPDAFDFGFHLFDPSLPPVQSQPQPPKGNAWRVVAIVGVVAGIAIGGWLLRRHGRH
jgi:D-alanyl-D-alanine-carboxypeptidase/D-alanyl-D-alanine-endopeptidase